MQEKLGPSSEKLGTSSENRGCQVENQGCQENLGNKVSFDTHDLI